MIEEGNKRKEIRGREWFRCGEREGVGQEKGAIGPV